MDVKSRYVAIFSIALNIFFAARYFSTEPDTSALNPADTESIAAFEPDARNNSLVVSDSEDLNEVYLSLIKQGLSQEQTKSLLFTKLKQQYIDTIEKPNDKFWIHQPLAQIEYMEALSMGYQQVRKDLQSIYGHGVKDDPVVRDLFYPVANQYPFLSSQKQIALQQMQLDMHKSAMSMQSQGGDLNGISSGRSPQDMLKAVLDEVTLKEYQLRTSPMADKMRRTDLQFTEQHFRRAFNILDQLQSPQGSGVATSILEDLKELLGDQDGLILWAAVDPMFPLIKRISLQHNVSNDKALAAYDLVITAKKEISEAAQQKNSDPQAVIFMIQQLMIDLKNQLSSMVGDSAANDFINLVNGRRS